MKLLVIGCGQCGGRIADEFVRLNQRARRYRGMEIITGAYAVNTDEADLTGLRNIKSDFHHRILIGGRRTSGHGVGKINELGAELAKEDSDKVVDAIRLARDFYETDAFLLIAAGAGGTGSGSISVLAQNIKDRYRGKPVYALVVLPFEHEELTEERCVYNTGTCLKSVSEVADAVILADNQRYVRKDASLANNVSIINQHIAEPFYDLLCAGEEKKRKHIGSRVVDAGDIIQTLEGWTVIGFGRSTLSLIAFPWERGRHFKDKGRETHKGIAAMDVALTELSLSCNPSDAGRALYLLCAPKKEMNVDIVKELGSYFRELAPNAVIRGGDYPREKGSLDVTIVLSQLAEVERVRSFYAKSADYLRTIEMRREEVERRLDSVAEAGKDLPTLL
jgi:cell division GTPase FtsZ